MELNRVQQLMTVLPTTESDSLRTAYVGQFINTASQHYQRYIAKYESFSDGLCYTGYLWDCLRQKRQATEEEIRTFLAQKAHVFVMWDVHSQDRIRIRDYWKFPKRSVLSADAGDVLDSLRYLPEDLYIFDDSLDWTCVLTHEDVDGHRLCFLER